MAGKVSVWLAARLAARSYPAQNFLAADDDDELMLNVLRCHLTY